MVHKETVLLEMERDPELAVNDIHDLSKIELRERTLRKIVQLAQYVPLEDRASFKRRMIVSIDRLVCSRRPGYLMLDVLSSTRSLE